MYASCLSWKKAGATYVKSVINWIYLSGFIIQTIDFTIPTKKMKMLYMECLRFLNPINPFSLLRKWKSEWMGSACVWFGWTGWPYVE